MSLDHRDVFRGVRDNQHGEVQVGVIGQEKEVQQGNKCINTPPPFNKAPVARHPRLAHNAGKALQMQKARGRGLPQARSCEAAESATPALHP